MTYRDRLRNWFIQARAEDGVVDIKFYPGEQRDLPIEQLAEEVYQIVSGESETVDVTDSLH